MSIAPERRALSRKSRPHLLRFELHDDHLLIGRYTKAVKSPVPAISYINTKGWARGRRTVAGTMVLTQLSTDVLASFLTSSAFTSDLSKDSQYVKVDQLPPFNISMLFADEYGHMSYQRILGIEFVTSGNVHSIQDMLSEQTRSLRPAGPQNPSRGRAKGRPNSRFGSLLGSSKISRNLASYRGSGFHTPR